MTLMITGRTDRETDGQKDRVRRNMRPPPREEGRIIINPSLLYRLDRLYSVQADKADCDR